MLRKYIYLLILILCFTSISEASLHRSVSSEMRRTVQNKTYAYDALNRLASINFPDPTQNVSYTYDSTGKVLTMSDPSGLTSYVYDNSNRLLTDTKTTGGISFVTSYSYSVSGALTSITYPSGRVISYIYDSNGRVIKVTETKDNKTSDIITNIVYNTNGTVSNIVYGNGILTEKGYDVKGMLNSLNIGNLKQLTYTRDNVGNITAINDVLEPSKTKTYNYDSLYRLTQATGPWGTISYGYDGVGNRLTENSTSGTTNYSYTANKLMSSAGAKVFNFSYDNNGNTVSENQKQYTYNQNQRLIKAVEDSKVLGEYVYNANGQRVKKVANGRTTHYIYNQSGNMIGEYDEQGQVNIDYIYLGSVPIARVDEWWEGMSTPQAPTGVSLTPGDKQLTVSWNANTEPVDGYKVEWGIESGKYMNSVDVGDTTTHTITGLTNGTTYYIAVKSYADLKETYFYHTDHLGTPIILTDSNGSMVWSGELLPFGERYSVKGKVTNNLGMLGQYYDIETGLYYNWFRYDNPEIGRYSSFDPLLHPANGPPFNTMGNDFLFDPANLNPFIHLKNNPVNNIDPTGEAVYTCVRPLDAPFSKEILKYLGLGHQYLWVDSMTPYKGWGLAPKNGYAAFLSLTMFSVPGLIKSEGSKVGCKLETDDPCREEKIKKIIEQEQKKKHTYNLKNHNCYHWVREVLWQSWQ